LIHCDEVSRFKGIEWVMLDGSEEEGEMDVPEEDSEES